MMPNDFVSIQLQVKGDTFTDGHRELSECGQIQRVFFVSYTTYKSPEKASFQLIGPLEDIIGMAPESD
jgi:hypothetical protein